MRTTSFPVYDADNHLYEPEEAFIRHTLGEASKLDLSDEIRDRRRYQNGKSFFLDRLDAPSSAR